MAIQYKTTTKAGATNIKDETTPNANTATRVGTQFENQIDSAMYVLEDSPTDTFSEELAFDDKRTKFIVLKLYRTNRICQSLICNRNQEKGTVIILLTSSHYETSYARLLIFY